MNAGVAAASVTTGMGEEVREASQDERLRANTYGLLGALLAAPPSESLITLLTRITPAEVGGDGDLAAAWEVLRLAGERAGHGERVGHGGVRLGVPAADPALTGSASGPCPG